MKEFCKSDLVSDQSSYLHSSHSVHKALLLLLVLICLFNLGTAQTANTDNALSDTLSFMEITVQEGDSLAKLATTYGITVSHFMELNNLDTTFITVGSSLIVPSTIPSTVPFTDSTLLSVNTPNLTTVTIKQGDTLSELAMTYNTSIESIQNYNQLRSSTIYAGQSITIPQISMTTPSEEAANVFRTNNINRLPDADGYITVLPNDTISALAQTYCSSPSLLMGKNDLNSPDIFVGQRLFVGQVETIATMIANITTNTVSNIAANSTTNTTN